MRLAALFPDEGLPTGRDRPVKLAETLNVVRAGNRAFEEEEHEMVKGGSRRGVVERE
jgi:hypothetical protein